MRFKAGRVALVALVLAAPLPTRGETVPPAKVDFVHGTYLAHVRADRCAKPIFYPDGGYLQGWEYSVGFYCFNPRILTVKPYEPRSMLGVPR